MLPLSVMALFCEDIREEKGDIFTLVGILPDSVNFEEMPAPGARLLSKLCIYVRINFDPEAVIGSPKIWLVMPDGERLALGDVGSEIVTKAQSEAKAKGNVLAGVVSRAVLAGFRAQTGSIKVEVDAIGETTIAGALTFNVPQ